MTLRETIARIKCGNDGFDWTNVDVEFCTPEVAEAIATILNAVVKGELTPKITALETVSILGDHGGVMDDGLFDILDDSVKGELK